MERLMTDILRNVTRKQTDLPLDLSYNRCTRYTSDPLFIPDDLRYDVDAAVKVEPRHDSSFTTAFAIPGPSTDEDITDVSSTESSEDVSGATDTDDSVSVKREAPSPLESALTPHPFSMAAILGDGEDTSGVCHESTDAVVISSYSRNLFYNTLTHDSSYSILPRVQSQGAAESPSPGVTTSDSYWCHVCNALCMDVEDAWRHVYFHRAQNAKCNLRRSLLHIHGYVSNHKKIDDERMACGLCDKPVANCFFTKHQRLHDGHFCDVCDKEFSTNSRLQDHMNVHSGKTPFVCNICDRKFAKRSSLTQHHRYHRDQDSFRCKFCSKSFNSKYARAVHERLHTGENPFKCQMPGCSRAYPQKIQLKLHIRSHF